MEAPTQLELRRWLAWQAAGPRTRAHAGYVLAGMRDVESERAVAALVDVPDASLEAIEALVKLHATSEVPHILGVIKSRGSTAPGACQNLRALCDMDAVEAWDGYLELGRSSDAAWRRCTAGMCSRDDELPPKAKELGLERLEDPDREARDDACITLVGQRPGYGRYPELNKRIFNPCNDSASAGDQFPHSRRVELIRDAVGGRPLPELPRFAPQRALPVSR